MPQMAGRKGCYLAKGKSQFTRAHARPDSVWRRLKTRHSPQPLGQVRGRRPTGGSSALCAPGGAKSDSRPFLGARRLSQVAGPRVERALRRYRFFSYLIPKLVLFSTRAYRNLLRLKGWGGGRETPTTLLLCGHVWEF